MGDLIKQRIITEGDKLYETIIKLKPLPRCYNSDTEPVYVKWHCPVCMECGFTCLSLCGDEINCPVCGVNLDWKAVL